VPSRRWSTTHFRNLQIQFTTLHTSDQRVWIVYDRVISSVRASGSVDLDLFGSRKPGTASSDDQLLGRLLVNSFSRNRMKLA
jgi:hypothetical protein